MANEAIGMIETKGLGGSGSGNGRNASRQPASNLWVGTRWAAVSARVFVTGDVGSVRAAVDAGASAARSVGEVQSVHVIARPHDNLTTVLPK